jgi:hypothetical protein
MIVQIHPHARQRMRERGATADQVRRTILIGHSTPAKFGRTQFSQVFSFNASWNGKFYARKRIDAFAAKIPRGWIVITLIVRYF